MVFSVADSGIVMTGSEDSMVRNIFIDGDVMRIDIIHVEGEEKGRGHLIFRFDSAGSVLTVVDLEDDSYYEITSRDMQLVKDQVAQALKMIEEVLKNIPEDQREKSLPLIRGLIPPEYLGLLDMVDATQRVEKKQAGVRVGDWVCDVYAVYENDTVISRAWFADVGQFGLEIGDFRILEKFDEFLEIPAPGLVPGFLISEAGDGNSIPLKILEVDDDGTETSIVEVRQFSRQSINPSTFEVPEGLTKQELPF